MEAALVQARDSNLYHHDWTIEPGVVHILGCILKFSKANIKFLYICICTHTCLCLNMSVLCICMHNIIWDSNFKNNNYKFTKIFIWTTLLEGNSVSNSQTWCAYWSLGRLSSGPSVWLVPCPLTRSYASLIWYRWHQNEGLRGKIVGWAPSPALIWNFDGCFARVRGFGLATWALYFWTLHRKVCFVTHVNIKNLHNWEELSAL